MPPPYLNAEFLIIKVFDICRGILTTVKAQPKLHKLLVNTEL